MCNGSVASSNVEVAIADDVVRESFVTLEIEGAVVHRVPHQFIACRACIASEGKADVRCAEEVEDDLLLVGDGSDGRAVRVSSINIGLTS